MGQVAPRAPGWPALLEAEVAAWRARPFIWGAWDCLSFCRATAVAMCGADPLGILPGYVSRRDALKQLRAGGYPGAVDLVAAHLIEIAPRLARRGDWVQIPGEGSFGVNLGRRSAHMGLSGLVMINASASARAWRVGQ